jgi:hypothetical protein
MLTKIVNQRLEQISAVGQEILQEHEELYQLRDRLITLQTANFFYQTQENDKNTLIEKIKSKEVSLVEEKNRLSEILKKLYITPDLLLFIANKKYSPFFEKNLSSLFGVNVSINLIDGRIVDFSYPRQGGRVNVYFKIDQDKRLSYSTGYEPRDFEYINKKEDKNGKVYLNDILKKDFYKDLREFIRFIFVCLSEIEKKLDKQKINTIDDLIEQQEILKNQIKEIQNLFLITP